MLINVAKTWLQFFLPYTGGYFGNALEKQLQAQLNRAGPSFRVTTVGAPQHAVKLEELLAVKVPAPEHEDTWGKWQYDAKILVLTHRTEKLRGSTWKNATQVRRHWTGFPRSQQKAGISPKDLGGLRANLTRFATSAGQHCLSR